MTRREALGTWEVFQDVHVMSRGMTMDEMMPFELYTVAETLDPLMSSGGMKIVPNRTFADAGKPKANTHHDFFEQFAKQFPDIKVKRGLRFVERYFGRPVAQQTADYMEYQGKGWMV